ncbi:RNA-guided endonuclease TnpB family protein [Undibacterium sp. FT79W]|uniref:RNA-guided endonuclease InsQ/TnpB family protein n=1 Tax=Undibacterium sp. FT79W TaxID=2762296 RepID=UPI002102FC40|nr:RNA-guided endonuclease TnpB family protein [Undibacterium sp. FT79W]
MHSQTIQAISEEYATRRKQFKKVKLRWRVSTGSRRSLGWLPFKASALTYRNGQVWLSGIATPLSLWDSYRLSQCKLGAGSIAEDVRGRWYLNITVKVPKAAPTDGRADLGIYLGLKDFAGFSDDAIDNIEAPQFYRDLESVLAVVQRANKISRVKTIHAKIANCRKDFQHKLSTTLVRRYGAIFVGNVNASALAQTRMPKSVLDAGWSQFRSMLQYKCDDAGGWFVEVN